MIEIKDENSCKSFLSDMKSQLGNPYVIKEDVELNTDTPFFDRKEIVRRNSS